MEVAPALIICKVSLLLFKNGLSITHKTTMLINIKKLSSVSRYAWVTCLDQEADTQNSNYRMPSIVSNFE